MPPATSDSGADSAGQPWAGRTFEANTSADDDGAAPEHLTEAIRRFRSRELGEAEVVDALRISRLLIPLVARLGEDGLNEHGHDKTQELSIVTVVGPDGRTVLPAFTSVAAMSAWNPQARPIPVQAQRVALAAASEQTDLVVVDATSATVFVIRRPALSAMAGEQPWIPCYLDEAVLDAFADTAAGEPAVRSIALAAGDPDSRLTGPELIVVLTLAPGLDQLALDALLSRLQQRWSASEVIAQRVDSMTVRLTHSA
jgi:hypothetical protein